MERVVVTGMAAITPLGHEWQSVSDRLRTHATGIRYMPQWEEYGGLLTRLAAPVPDFSTPAHYTRKQTRSMGRGSVMAARVTELALAQARLAGEEALTDGSTGVAYGSSNGCTSATLDFGSMLMLKNTSSLNANTYLKMMAHTAPVNLAVFFQLKGRLYTTSSACTSGSQAIGSAYEAIKYGKQKFMVAGGTEELCATQAAVFDTLYATSTSNATPEQVPRPFDRDRDGLVIGEGACTFILESLRSAQERGADIIAEVVGYGTNCDGSHVTQPSRATMKTAMELALGDAGLSAGQIGYVSAHGTSTERGDVAESHATHDVFGSRIPISAFKSYSGHTLGACGAIESWVSLNMLREGWFHPTANLRTVDPECAELDYIMDQGREIDCEYVMSNNFAFGGINTSLIFRKWVG